MWGVWVILWVILISAPRPQVTRKASTSSYLKSSHNDHYFQWFTGYLNQVDLLMLHVAPHFKETALLFRAPKLFFGFYLAPN